VGFVTIWILRPAELSGEDVLQREH